MRALIINQELKDRINDIVEFARANPYVVGETVIPGDDSRYVLNTGTGYRVVFSYTKTQEGGYYRDISISVEARDKWPNPTAAFTLAQLFGFTGYSPEHEDVPDDWLMAKDIHYDAIRIVQAIE